MAGTGSLTALFALEAWAISSGRLRKWPERYAATDSPGNVRHGFAVLWAGVISGSLVTIVFALIAVERAGWAAAVLLLIFASGYFWWRWRADRRSG